MRSKKFRNLMLAASLWGVLGQAPVANAVVATQNMKWNPGHYLLNGKGNLATQMNDFQNIPALKGVIRNYLWSELEGNVKGSYNFQPIRDDLNLLKANGKKLGIMIEYKYNNDTDAPVSNLPKYIRDLPKVTVNGVAQIAPFYQLDPAANKYNIGDHANFGHPGTRQGFADLLQHLAAEFDDDPDFVLIQFIESALGVSISSDKVTNFLNGGMLMEDAARQAFARTPLFKNLNSPRNKLQIFIDNITSNAMGVGGPDVFVGAFGDPNDSLTRTDGGFPGIYNYYGYNYNATTNSNHLPISMMIHKENFIYDTFAKRASNTKNNRSPAAEVNTLIDFANTKLHPNYLIWQTFPNDVYYPAFKSKLAAEGQSNPNSILGLVKACPTVYTSCAGMTPPAPSPSPTPAPGGDTEGPIITINGLVNNEVLAPDRVNIWIDVTAQDPAGVSKLELFVNNNLKKTVLDAALLYKWEVSLLPQGVYSIKVRATDSAGNVRNKIISVTVNQ